MPTSKDLKRLTRTRMKKTGESYTTARSKLLDKREKKAAKPSTRVADHAALAGISDAAVQKATGCRWELWVKALDHAGASRMSHRDIAKHISEKYEISGWWAQTVTVGYERIRGLREKGQRRGGSYEVNKSKTIAVPVGKLYKAFSTRRARGRWLGDAELKVRTSRVDRSVRMVWGDGTPVEAYFWSKGTVKSQVQLQHRGLASRAAAEKMRAYWTERFAELGRVLVPRRD